MAWSYSMPSGKRAMRDGAHFLNWWNSWTLTELSPLTAGTIRLQFTLETSGYYKGRVLDDGSIGYSGYQWYCTDRLVCGDETVPLHARYEALASTNYTAVVEVPASWNGRTVRIYAGYTGPSATLDATVALPSTVTAEDGFFGQAVAVTINPAVSGVRHRLSVSCAGRTEQLLSTADATTALTWTPAVETYAPLLPSAGSASAVLTCETFYNGTSMGSATRTITVAFSPGSLAPVCAAGWASASVLNEGAAQGFTVWIQGKSKAAVSFDPTKITCRYGAAIAGCQITCDGVTDSTSPYETGVLPGTSASILCTVTDSRGQSTGETLTVTLLPYAAPVLAAAEVSRCLADGTASEDGSCLAVEAEALISPLGGENRFTLSASVRPLSGSFGAETALQSGVRTILSGYSPDTSYALRLTLTDGLGAATSFTRTLPTRRWAMKFRPDGNGAAFGKAPEQNAALELANGWALVLHDAQGNTAYLDYARLSALLGTIQ